MMIAVLAMTDYADDDIKEQKITCMTNLKYSEKIGQNKTCHKTKQKANNNNKTNQTTITPRTNANRIDDDDNSCIIVVTSSSS